MELDRLRYSGDRELYAMLLKEATVRAAIEKHGDDRDVSLRRDLLGSALRLTAGISSEMMQLVAEARERLGVQKELELELFVYPSAQLNAACTAPSEGRVFLLFSSSIVDGFSPAELRFVVGHELGHHLFGHHKIPTGRLIDPENGTEPGIVLELFQWQRAAEISADRAGLLCTDGFDAAGQALFKLTSGLVGPRLHVDLDAFLKQAGDLAMSSSSESDEPQRDWYSTHPFSPLRVQALKLCADSVLASPSGAGLDELEDRTRDLLALMEPSYAREKTEVGEALRRLFFAAGIAIAAATGGIVDEERRVLERFLGKDSLPDSINPAALVGVLDQRAAAVKEIAPEHRRRQLLRDLCIIARADGHVDPEERVLLDRVANGIGVDATVIDAAIAVVARPLD